MSECFYFNSREKNAVRKRLCRSWDFFSFIYASLDRALGCEDNPGFTAVHTLYSDIVFQILCTKPKREKRHEEEVVTSEKTRCLIISEKKLSKEPEDFILVTLIFYCHDRIVEEMSRVGALHFFERFPFEHSNYGNKKVIKRTSIRHGSTMEEAVKAMNWSVAIEKRKKSTGGGNGRARLVRDN